MCRFVAYMGENIFMADLLMRSNRSLIRQRFDARESKEPLNGDGFGVGWYSPEIDPVPCVFTSITPAWSNRNLHRLTEKISLGCMFAHIRAASAGSLVSEVNCHPFQFERYLWMHNGRIARFQDIKRRLRASLSDEIYNVIQGATASEHAFAVFLDQLPNCNVDHSASSLEIAMQQTISLLQSWLKEFGISGKSYLNVAVTGGKSVVASRYVKGQSHHPETLYPSLGKRFEALPDSYRMKRAEADHPISTAILASEPLTDSREDLEPIPPGHVAQIDNTFETRFTPMMP